MRRVARGSGRAGRFAPQLRARNDVSVTFVGLYLIVKCSPELMLSPLTVANVPLTALPVRMVKVLPIAGTKLLDQRHIESSIQTRPIGHGELSILLADG